MTIEKILEKILEELQTLNAKIPAPEFLNTPAPAAAPQAPAPAAAPQAPAPAAAPQAPAALTRADVGKALIALATNNNDAAVDALRAVGATTPALGEVDPARYAELMAIVTAAMPPAVAL